MKYEVSERLIWFKGEIVHVNDAKIDILAPTSQFGLNVFEGIPCYWNGEEKQLYAFRLDDHYDRLRRSAKLLQIDCPYTKDEMRKALIDTVRANEYDENLSVRQTLFVDGFGSWGSDGPVGMFVAPIPKARTSAEYNKQGLHVCVSCLAFAEDEIAFKRSYSPYACRIAMGTGVGVDHVFKRRAVVDAVVGIGGEVESEVGKVVFLLASDGTAGFEVEAVAFIQDLRVFQDADVPV